jgi:hypothetical protein
MNVQIQVDRQKDRAVADGLWIGRKLAGKRSAQAGTRPPVPVQAAHAFIPSAAQWDEGVGRLAPGQSVEARPLVSGA